MYRGGVGCEILNAPPVARPRDVPRASSLERAADERVLSKKMIMMRAIGLKEVRRKDDERPNGKISEKELELLESFRTVQECLDKMLSCLDDLLGCRESANTAERRENAVAIPDATWPDAEQEEAGKFDSHSSCWTSVTV